LTSLKGVTVEAETVLDPPRFRAYGRRHLDRLPEMGYLTQEQQTALKTVSAVLPFRVNDYVLRELIDWDDIPNDPIFQMTFPQVGMLDRRDFLRLQDVFVAGGDEAKIASHVRAIQMGMNPNPGGQKALNVPVFDGEKLPGCQHKYRETVLFFPVQGQTCHAYCTYCFRWAQFVGLKDLRFASRDIDGMVRYLNEHDEVSDVLITGGDPMVMSTSLLRRKIEPLLDARLSHVQSIRIGSKALAYWPYRFTTDRDADDLLRLFEQVRMSGRQLAFMAHFSHPRELQTRAVRDAMRRILDTGAVIRCQAPLIRHVNDKAETWAEMWRQQVLHGAVPYYMFVERDTGPKQYFEVPLARGLRIFSKAYSEVSGLARTVRGPSMSATPGKVLVDGVVTIGGEKIFVLKMVQGRDPEWANRVFFARFDAQAYWLDDLHPAVGEHQFFFEPYMRAMYDGRWRPEWLRTEDSEEELTA
jgi:KamA family protein